MVRQNRVFLSAAVVLLLAFGIVTVERPSSEDLLMGLEPPAAGGVVGLMGEPMYQAEQQDWLREQHEIASQKEQEQAAAATF